MYSASLSISFLLQLTTPSLPQCEYEMGKWHIVSKAMGLFVNLVILAILGAVHGQDSIEQFLQACPGGVCVSKAFCPNKTNNQEYASESRVVHLRFDDVDECADYLMICCKTDSFASKGVHFEDDSHRKALRFNEESSETSDVTCGKTNENGLFYELHSNETLAQYGEFPWVVYIFTTNETTSSGTFVCGGTLIHPLLVLTTAHNVHRKTNLIARFGEWDIGTDKEPFPHQDVNVADVFIHPAFTLSPIQNDIAILFLKESIQYQPHIQPICLPQPDAVFDEQRCISNGWGTVEGTYAKIMKKLTLPVIPRAKCQRMLRFAGLGPFYKLREGFMCAGGEGIVDTCKGDGGSPLACQQQDGSFVLAGIVSWGIGCGGDNIPGVYVAINNYIAWINDKINNSSLLTGT
uniref:Phenoloxidase-activating factor 2 n=1 Tax=Anopheles atroparvus TaxID=41427 RepID=A0AAG5DPH2_ANOAO